MLTGRFALLEYDVPGPIVMHERMILDHVESDDYVVCTPDRDLFVEQLTVENSDLRSFRLRPQPHQLPPGVPLGRVYALPAWNAGEIAAIKDEARRLAQAEKAQRGLAQAGGVGPPLGPPVPVATAVLAEAGSGGAGVHQLTPGVPTWVAAEAAGGFFFGQVVDGVQSPAVLGSKCVHVTAEGQSVFCMCISDATKKMISMPGLPCVTHESCVGR